MAFIDAHCHLSDPRFDEDREAVVARARAAGIHGFVLGGVDPGDWERQSQLPAGCFPVYGLHPWTVAAASDEELNAAFLRLEQMAPHAVAIGELGLDYSITRSPEDVIKQVFWFQKQLALAVQLQKPLVLHLVHCHADALAILSAARGGWRGLVHGFTGSWEIAQAYLRQGLHLSISGAVTRPGYKKLKAAVPRIPDDRLVVESDAPDGLCDGDSRSRNEPDALWRVAQGLSALRLQPSTDILTQATANLQRLFSLEIPP